MSGTVKVLILLSQLSWEFVTSQSCEPNKQFFINGLSCACDSVGRWQETDCRAVQRGQDCQPGGVVQIGCSQCVCQSNRQLTCDDRICSEDLATNARRGLDVIGQWCTPFKSYYVDCSVCVCSASGRTSDAQCVKDTSCSLNESVAIKTEKKNICLPKVTYLFPCLHCLCSENGHFEIDKCVEICQKEPLELVARCKPRKLYRKECNLCLCPDNGIENDLLCSKNSCPNVVRSKTFRSLQENDNTCLIHSFTKKRCIYCECTADGQMDEDACIEAECLKFSAVDYSVAKKSCTAGEMVPICSECFCLSNKTINKNYCSRSCSSQIKLSILEKVLQDSSRDKPLINRDKVKKLTDKICRPNEIYLKDDKYCLCGDNGVISEELCTIQKERVNLQAGLHNIQFQNFNITCEPSTFVQFDCNTCFCSKNGTIDSKWCTYDDCKDKKLIWELHKKKTTPLPRTSNGTCISGTISKEECNFCICSETGLVKDRACTKNRCEDVESSSSLIDKFSCEPLSYYEVDCNICYCPRDGLKNVSNCTKNTCEKNFLRSNACVPGQLFSDECNVCICPPNGDKNDKACTKNTCSETMWKDQLKMSSLMGTNQIIDDLRMILDHCFPGEEYFMGCKMCVCPDMGLKSYATCNQMLCANEHVLDEGVKLELVPDSKHFGGRSRRHNQNENCTQDELPDLPDNSPPCTKGTTYIIDCKQCLCQSEDGSIFCRPLLEGSVCNQNANVTISASGAQRRQSTNTTSISSRNGTATASSQNPKQILVEQPHTTYPCPKPGPVKDECFICECEESNNVIVQERCFKNEAEKCEDALATFLITLNKNLHV